MALVTVAQQMPQLPKLPTESKTRIGHLDNGLTYYIRHNEYPEHVANFYIAQRVGSIQEEDDQRGLAHFLEHMAFNGSTHFKPGDLIEYTRSLGVAFGRDLNAYTSIEQTVYNIDNVPTTRQSALDSCLLILQDWSNGLLLLGEEIDKERGVIHGEWAMRNNAMQRLIERNLPAMYPGCKYGERMPIGTMEVVDGFSYDALRKYYKKWYHPENQAIIVIGDIDVDHTEATIRDMFSGIKASEDAAHVTPVQVPDNEQAIYVSDKDKEMQFSIISIMLKTDPLPEAMHGTQAEYVMEYMSRMMTMMFNSRMSEMVQDPSCPFINANASYGSYLVSKTKNNIEFSVTPKEGMEREAMAALVREIYRVKLFGFNASEYIRAKEEFMSQAEKAFSNRDKRKNTQYYQMCVNHFLDGEAMPDAEIEYQLWQALSQGIPVEQLNMMCQQGFTITEDKNLVAFCFAQEKDGAQYLTPEDMKQIVEAGRTETLTAWVDNTKDEPLISKMPKAGKIKSEKKNDTLGFTELTLSNGARVILKKTDFRDDEVLLSGWAPGGQSMYSAADYSNMKVWNSVASTFGLGNFTNNELEKALAGKQAGVSLSLGRRFNNVTGHSTPKDLETMMQLLYLNFTSPQKDEKAYQTLYTMLETQLKTRDLQPETQFSDSIMGIVYNHNPRFAPITMEDLPNVSLDRCMEIARERYSNANNFTFTLIGNFDEAQARQLICQYIASLPGKEKAVKSSNISTHYSGNVTSEFTRKMETPKPYIFQMYLGEIQDNLRNQVLTTYAGQVLSMVLLKSVREEAGATYSISASGTIEQAFTPAEKSHIIMQTAAPISIPEKLDSALILVDLGFEEVAKAADPDMVAKVKANLLKEADVQAKQNGHWASIISDLYIFNQENFTQYKSIVESITPEDVSTFVRNYILNSGNKARVIMRPE